MFLCIFLKTFSDKTGALHYVNSGEIENLDRKNQKDLSRTPEQRRAIGWAHDATLSIKITGNPCFITIINCVRTGKIVERYAP
jgi:hypothetical protein